MMVHTIHGSTNRGWQTLMAACWQLQNMIDDSNTIARNSQGEYHDIRCRKVAFEEDPPTFNKLPDGAELEPCCR